jgi:hypothetical protein
MVSDSYALHSNAKPGQQPEARRQQFRWTWVIEKLTHVLAIQVSFQLICVGIHLITTIPGGVLRLRHSVDCVSPKLRFTQILSTRCVH